MSIWGLKTCLAAACGLWSNWGYDTRDRAWGGSLENICKGMLKDPCSKQTFQNVDHLYCKKKKTPITIPHLWLNQLISIPFLLKWWPIIIIFISKTPHRHTITEVRGHQYLEQFQNHPIGIPKLMKMHLKTFEHPRTPCFRENPRG